MKSHRAAPGVDDESAPANSVGYLGLRGSRSAALYNNENNSIVHIKRPREETKRNILKKYTQYTYSVSIPFFERHIKFRSLTRIELPRTLFVAHLLLYYPVRRLFTVCSRSHASSTAATVAPAHDNNENIRGPAAVSNKKKTKKAKVFFGINYIDTFCEWVSGSRWERVCVCGGCCCWFLFYIQTPVVSQ